MKNLPSMATEMGNLTMSTKTFTTNDFPNLLYFINTCRQEEKIIHRLCLGIVGLNEDLYRLGLHDTGHCSTCPEPETVQHLLTACPSYIIPRAMLITETNLLKMHQLMILLKSPITYIQRALIRYVHRTKRFVK